MAANVMTTPNGAFVEYLNTLHNVSANNQSAITELSITNPFFVKTMVQREVGKAIKESLENKPAHIFVLTGHAGDGKTGLLFQTLRSWKAIDEGKSLGLTGIVSLPSGKKLRYVKDFSELSANDRITCLNRAIVECSQGISTFLVANTGPLILGFEACFSSEVQNQLVEAIDSNDGQIKHYDGTPIAIINVATIDNSTFVRPFIKNILSEDLWSPCKTCEKSDYCVIFANRCIIDQSRERVSDFITKHYVFQQEYGKKLTIRQIVAHLSYSITGGLTCQNIKNSERAKFNYLFTNNFFGYKGIHASKDAQTMKAISDVVHAKYDYKRLRADETLFIKGALTDVFTKQIATLLSEEGLRCHHSEEWQRAVRRAYMFLNIDTSETSQKHLVQDVFSVWYPRYLQLRSGQSATSGDKELIQDALQINDADDRLNSALCDYLALQNVSEADQQKYGRHYADKLQQTEENIRNAFDSLKKQRLRVTSLGVQPFNSRLAIALTEVFESVYPRAVPFDFDGFDSKQPGKARKAFCSITRLILSGALSEDTIHSFPADVRNRLEATLFSSGAFSWKIINTNYQIVPPTQKDVKSVYDEIVDSLPEGGELALDALIAKITAPPYGMNDYVAVYMIVTLCANLSYCLRVVMNGAIYSIASWKDEVIQDNKIDLGLIRKSKLKRVNAGAVADRFLRLFAQIESNMDIGQVASLAKELDTMKQAEDIPEALEAQYQLALNRIQEGNRVKKSWDTVKASVMEKYDQLLGQRDIYSGLQAIQTLGGISFYSCFSDTSYAMTEDQRTELSNLKKEIEQLVDPFLSGWIAEQRCKGVENISQYRKHMERIRKLLSDLGYDEAAKAVSARAEQELSNVENIRARQQLRSNYSDFLQTCVVTKVVPYVRLLEWRKQGETLLEHISKFASSLGKDAEKFSANVSNRMSDIVKSIERIKQDMNDIYDDIYSISCVEDIQDMLERIQLVCQKGIPQTDLADFEELKKALEAFLADITALTDCQDDRDAFEAQYSTLLKQYSDDEFDFDVVSIIEQVGQSIRESMEAKDLAWRSRYLEPMLNGRVELLSWVDKTRLLPKYLSEETLQSYYERKKDVDQQLSQAKIDDVIYSFRKLEEKEKEACFDQLVDIYKNGGENTNDIDLPFTRNKKWDLEEWIVLVKVYFEHKDKSRSELNELLSPLSLMLVRRADALGIEHDEKYRNINGLAMQFDRIKYMDTKGAKGLSAYSELAEAALKMYHTDREGFELLAKKCWEKYGAD